MNRQIDYFMDFMFKKIGKTCYIRCINYDTIISKEFIRNSKPYILVVRFTRNGEYVCGYLTDEHGYAYVNGKGFLVESFCNLIKAELKPIPLSA